MSATTTPVAVERLDVETSSNTAQVFLHKQRYDFALSRLSAADSVLEVGTGTGFFSDILANHCSSYTGLEIDPASCEESQRRVGERGRVVEGDAQTLPFPSDSFSASIALEVLEHIPDYRKAVREIHRCLKLDGQFIISVPYRTIGGKNDQNPYHLYEPGENELVQCLNRYFAKIEVFYQYFAETALMTAARLLHLRGFLGLAQVYGDLWNGVPAALDQIRIDPSGKGMRICLVLAASKPKKHSI
jgi:ubiquinone/menaquinone biosynthesis C-methylase UbiE